MLPPAFAGTMVPPSTLPRDPPGGGRRTVETLRPFTLTPDLSARYAYNVRSQALKFS